MIKPSEPSEMSTGFFFVCDIENNPDGSVISIDSAWRGDDKNIVHVLHRTWEAWIAWLLPLAESDKRFRTVYAHNGGGWDWLSLAHYLLTRKDKPKGQVISAACAASKMITMTCKFAKKLSIHFADSLQLLRSSLDALGKKFVGRGKVYTGGKLPHEMPWDDMIDYQRWDTELLLLVMESALDIVRDKVAKIDSFGYTIGSTAMKVFKTIGNFDPITVPWNPVEKEFFRRGYTGGRVEVFQRGYFPAMNVYDINSLYPHAMLTTEVPTSDRVSEVSEIQPSDVGIYEVEFSQYNRDIVAVLTQGGGGVYEGTGVYFSPELHLLREVDPNAKISVVKGYKFVDTGKVFCEYVNRLYALRLSDPDGPLSLLCKFLLNSLYGKFGQKAERDTIVQFDNLEDMIHLIPEDGESDLIPLSLEYGIYKLTVESDCKFEHVGIAGMITSAARVSLYRGIQAAGKRLIYCDTDSVHCTGKLPDGIVNKKTLGLFKHEFTGEGVYCGKKLYGLRDKGKGVEKIRAKGVSVGGNNGCRLTFDSLCGVARGETFTAEFSQPTTARQTFAITPPCVFRKKTRKLRVT